MDPRGESDNVEEPERENEPRRGTESSGAVPGAREVEQEQA